MKPRLSCPRCGRSNPSRARFCGNCGLSFVSAGLIAGPDDRPRPRGSGILGVLAGFLLVFALLAVLSLARTVLPRTLEAHLRCSAPFEPPRVLPFPDERRPLIRRETGWVFFDTPRTRNVRYEHRCR